MVGMELQKETISQKHADEHTTWAYERTGLAKERTFAAWVRTGLSSIAVGLALVKLLPSVRPRWLLHTIGILFAGTGGTLFVLGYRTYHVVIKKLGNRGIMYPGDSYKIFCDFRDIYYSENSLILSCKALTFLAMSAAAVMAVTMATLRAP